MPLALAVGLQRAQEEPRHLAGRPLGLPELCRQHLLLATEDVGIHREVSVVVGEGQAVGRGVQEFAVF